jgi:antitoxin HigA-1
MRRCFEREARKALPLAAKLRRLARLNDGPLPDAMSAPGCRLHHLKGDRKGSWSAWASDKYRLIFDMFDPPHPGEIIREDCLKLLNLSVTDAAKGLGESRQSLFELLNGRNGICADTAVRLKKRAGARLNWLRNQLLHHLWRARQHADSLKVTRFPAPDSI